MPSALPLVELGPDDPLFPAWCEVRAASARFDRPDEPVRSTSDHVALGGQLTGPGGARDGTHRAVLAGGEVVDDRALLERRMTTDAPHGDLPVAEEQWDARRREYEAMHVARGRTVLSAGAVRDGRLVGFTELQVPLADQRTAHQGGTLVLQEHHGHRLGALLEAAVLREVLADHPGVRRIRTANADENTPVVAVIEALGSVPAGRLPVGEAPAHPGRGGGSPGRRRAVATALALLTTAGCGTGEQPPDPVRGGAPSVTFVGDSWTVGLGATETDGYAPLTAAELGWGYTELGVSGSGYVRPGDGGPFSERIDDAVAGRPDAVVVQGSLNDQLADVDDVAAAARETLARLADAAGPGTEVLVVGAPGCPNCDGAAISAINDVLSQAAESAGLPFVDPAEERWVDPDIPGLWADALHPDDDGYRRMAQRLAPLLRDLVGA